MIGRRGLLALIGLGGGAAFTGGSSLMPASGHSSLGSAVAGASPFGESLNSASRSSMAHEAHLYSAGQQKAAEWLRSNGLPAYVRQRIRDSVEVTADQFPMPDDIKALRSFAPHLKRRLHVERLARLREREHLEDQIHNLTREVRQSVIPESVRKFMGWL